MSEDVSAGRLHLDAYADTTGLSRGLQKRIDAEVANIRARIKVELDTKGLVAQARKAAAEASKVAVVKVKTKLDSKGLIADVKRAAAEASKAAVVKIKVEVDSKQAEAEIAAVTQAAADSAQNVKIKVDADAAEAERKLLGIETHAQKVNNTNVDIGVAIDDINAARSLAELDAIVNARREAEIDIDANIAGAEAAIDAERSSQEHRPINIPVKANVNGLSSIGTAVMGLAKIPALVGGVYTLVSAVGALAGGLFAVASAAGQAAAGIAVLPNLVGAALQGVAALVIGFNGIGKAIGAMGKAHLSAAKDGQASAQAQVAAANRIKDAEYALGQAVHQRADDARQNAQAIKEADYQVGEAHRAVLKAERDLHDARAQARKDIQAVNEELRLSAGDEKVAMDAVIKAKEDLQDVNWDAASSKQEKRDAQDAVTKAEQDLKRVQARRRDLQRQAKEANRKGVEGSDVVVSAKDNLASARHAQQQAEQAAANARHQAADQARADNHAVAMAQRELSQARKADTIATNKQSAAQLGLTQAMDGLSPAGQRFAKFIYGLKPRWIELRDAVQTALLPPIQEGITRALPLLDTLQTGLVGTANVIGRFAKRLGTLFGSALFRDDVAHIMASNNRALDNFLIGMRDLIAVLARIARVAGPVLLEPFAKWVRTLIAGWRATLQTKKGMDNLRDTLVRARKTVKLLWDIFGHLFSAIHAVGKAAVPSGNSLLKSFDKALARWDKWANSDAGQKRMKQWFAAAKPVTRQIGNLLVNLSKMFALMAESDSGPLVGFLKVLNGIVRGFNALLRNKTLGPIFSQLMTLAGEAGALGLVAGGILKMGNSFRKIGKVTGLGKLIKGIRGSKDAIDDELPADKKKQKAMEGVGDKAEGAGKSLGRRFVDGAKRATKAAINGAKAVGKWGWAKFTSGASRAGGALRTAAAATGRWVATGVKAIASLSKQAALWALQKARILATKAVQLAMAAATKAVAAAQWILNAAMSANPIGLVIAAIVGLIAIFVVLYKKNAAFRKLVQRVWAAIKTAISWTWHHVLKPALQAFKQELHILGAAVSWLWRKVVRPYFRFIGSVIKWAWNKVIRPAVTAFKWYLTKVLGPAISWLWHKVIKPLWDNIGDKVRWVWRHMVKPAFDALKKGLTSLKKAFSTAVTAIRNAWDDVRGAVKKPIKGVISIINNGIIDKFNWISGKLHGPHIKRLSTSFAQGGSTGPGPRYQPAGIVHADEHVWTKPEVKAVGGHGVLEAMRAQVMKGYAAGGKVLRNVGQEALGRLRGYAKGGAVWPTTGHRVSSYPGHDGADINGPGQDYGNPIFAWRSGKITYAGWGHGYGHAIFEKAPGYPTVVYGHGSAVYVHGGQHVKAGQTIGRVGSTGHSTGPHLHFGVPGGTYAQALALLHGAKSGGGGGGIGAVIGGVIKHIPSFLQTLGAKVRGIVKKPADWFKSAVGGKVSDFLSKMSHSQMAQLAAREPKELVGKAAARVKAIFEGKKGAYNRKHPNAGKNITVGGSYPGGSVSGGGHMAPGAAMAFARKIMPRSWSWPALKTLWMGESGWRWNADNPTSSAYGIPQALPGSKMGKGWHDNAAAQIRWGLRYIAGRYGSSGKALASWRARSPHWYDTGGDWPHGTLGANMSGKTETVFTNENIVDAMSSLATLSRNLRSMTVEATVSGAGGKALVENLSLVGRPDEREEQLHDVNYELRRIQRGGVHASRAHG